MKTYSKVLSLLIVAVMCLSLFSASAYALSLDDSEALSIQPNEPAELFLEDDSLALNGSGAAAPAEITLEEPVALPAQGGAAAAAPAEITLEEPAAAGNTAANAAEDEITLESNGIVSNDPYNPAQFLFALQAYFDKSAPAGDVTITSTGAGRLQADTFIRLEYTKGPAHEGATTMSRESYVVSDFQIDIKEDFLLTLASGTYYFWGITLDGSPIKLGWIDVTTGTFGPFTVDPQVHEYGDGTPITVQPIPANFTKFAIVPAGSSSVTALSPQYYTLTGGVLIIDDDYLDRLEDGDYVIYGFINGAGTGIKMGTFTVYTGALIGNYVLTPDYSVWYSTDDPLVFYSDLMALRERSTRIIPDVRYGSSGPYTSVRVEQYWDLGNGYFMLGRKFLESLSAEEVYYLQVIDAAHPDVNYTNIVTFRVGPTLRAIDTDKHVINSTRSLRFRCSDTIYRVYVGNIELTDPADFGISWDGKTVTLSYEFLNKRSAGNTYTIKVMTTSGEYASTTFQILTTAQGSASPRTGDESNLGLWAAFLLLSGTAVVVLIPKLRNHGF